MDKYEQLQKLQELKENGTMTDAEFESEKAKILNGNNNKPKNHLGIIILCVLILIIGSVIVSNIISVNNAKKVRGNYKSSNEYSINNTTSNKYASKIKKK